MARWYIVIGGKKAGPFSAAEFFRYVKDKDPATARIWREGMTAWVPARDIPQLVARMGRAEHGAAANAPGGRLGRLLVRYWRGELSLRTSLFLMTALGATAAALVTLVMWTWGEPEVDHPPLVSFVRHILVWIAIIVPATWSLVGLWRCADRYRVPASLSLRHLPYGIAVQGAVIAGAIVLLLDAALEGAPRLYEAYRVTFLNDPDIPSYSIRVMRGGSEAEISGGFKYGLAADFEKIMKATPGIGLLHLDSAGGRIGEAIKLFSLVHTQGLSTYTGTQCLAACAVAFAGGRERYLASGATLGFKRGSDQDSSSRTQSEIFRRAGFDQGFIDQILAITGSETLKPDPEVLLRAKVVTAVVDRTAFASSDPGSVTRNEFESAVRASMPLLDTLQQKFPKQYHDLVNEFYGMLTNGRSQEEAAAAMRVKSIVIIKGLLPLADDDVLLDLNKLVAEKYRLLNERNPADCYGYASGSDPNGDYGAAFPRELFQRERDLYERAIKTAANRSTPDSARVGALQETVRHGMIANGVTEAQFNLLNSSGVPAMQHAEYCRLSIVLFREIEKLPLEEAASVMRLLIVGK